jgi:hypothetical protein
MTHQQMRGETIQASFKKFHDDNPHVYAIIKKEAIELIKKGAKKVSIKRVGNVVRWDKYFITEEPTLFESEQVKKFKVNDAYLSRYNRLFERDHPEYADKIETRRLRSI